MKKLLPLLLLPFLFCTTPAEAYSLEPEELYDGATGSFAPDQNGPATYASAFGYLPPQLAISFTFQVVGTPLFEQYGGDIFHIQHEGTPQEAYYFSEAGASADWGTTPASTSLYSEHTRATASAVEKLSLNQMPVRTEINMATRTVTFSNLTSAAAEFFTDYEAFLSKESSINTVSYQVSSVPLPAALPLFGLALAGIAGYQHRRKSS